MKPIWLSLAVLVPVSIVIAATLPDRPSRTATSPDRPTSGRSLPGRLQPDRLLHCRVGRMTNVDPGREQRKDEIILEGSYAFDVRLPAIPVRTTPPPESTAEPEPVDPRTRIVVDRDGLFRDVPKGFDRVVDLWPDRVEMVTNIAPPLVNLMVLNSIDAARGTVDLFMTRATDAVTYDFAHAYQGTCTVASGTR